MNNLYFDYITQIVAKKNPATTVVWKVGEAVNTTELVKRKKGTSLVNARVDMLNEVAAQVSKYIFCFLESYVKKMFSGIVGKPKHSQFCMNCVFRWKFISSE